MDSLYRIANKLRALNRQKNYFFKRVKTKVRLFLAIVLWDKRKKPKWQPEKIRRVLLLRTEGTIGDAVVYSSLIERLFLHGFRVDILMNHSNKMVMENSPCIENIYATDSLPTDVFLKAFQHYVPRETIDELRKNHYDLIIDPSLDTPVHRIKLLKDIGARQVIGFNKWKHINHYNHNIDFDLLNNHVTQAASLISQALGANKLNSIPYKINLPSEITREVTLFMRGFNASKIILINIFAGNKERCLSQQQLQLLIDKILMRYSNCQIILLDHLRQITAPRDSRAIVNPFKTLHHAMALISQSDLVITPDTSIVHISAAWQKALISVYKDIDDNNVLWAPGYDNASQIIMHSRQLSQVDDIPDRIIAEIERRTLLSNTHSIAEAVNSDEVQALDYAESA